jgi:hypothetical protein
MINNVLAGMVFRAAPQVYSGASARQTMTQKMSQVADRVDAGKTGKVSRSQFAAAFQNMAMPIRFKAMGADALFDKIDPQKKGTVSKQEFASRMKDVIFQSRSQGTQAANPQATPPVNYNSNSGANADVLEKAPTPSETLTYSLQSLKTAVGQQSGASSSGQGNSPGIDVYA